MTKAEFILEAKFCECGRYGIVRGKIGRIETSGKKYENIRVRNVPRAEVPDECAKELGL